MKKNTTMINVAALDTEPRTIYRVRWNVFDSIIKHKSEFTDPIKCRTYLRRLDQKGDIQYTIEKEVHTYTSQ